MPARSHGKSGTPEYRIWKRMKCRCYNPNTVQWKDYGGRGITVCREWRESFLAFMAAVGPRPEGFVLDRECNDKGYEPGNVRWVTRQVSNQNRRSSKIVNGETITNLAKKLSISPHVLRQRLRNGWTVDDALNHPAKIGFNPRPHLRQKDARS